MVFRNECYRLIIARSQNQIEYQKFVSLTLATPPNRVHPPSPHPRKIAICSLQIL